MALANFDYEDLKKKVLAAFQADNPELRKFREFAKKLKDSVRPLRKYSVNAVSFVSSDGGDNRLSFNPILIELVRVVDSRGNQFVLDAIPGTAKLADLEARAIGGGPHSVSSLQRLCTDLGKNLSQLSYLIRGMDDPGKSTGALRCFRDIVEWSVLYDLVTNPSLQWGGDTIIVRDGLLRTKSFTREAFPILDRNFKAGVEKHAERNVAISIVGVAKQSAVLGRLAVALELEATFHKPFPCYVRVPVEVEEECYNFDRTWLDTYETSEPDDRGRKLYQSMGNLFLVKFGDQPMDPVWPVDIAVWHVDQTEKILGQIVVDAQQGFPIPDYPMCIQRAHDFAKLSGLEIQVLQDMLLNAMSSRLTDEEAERLARMKYLGRMLAALRYKEG